MRSTHTFYAMGGIKPIKTALMFITTTMSSKGDTGSIKHKFISLFKMGKGWIWSIKRCETGCLTTERQNHTRMSSNLALQLPKRHSRKQRVITRQISVTVRLISGQQDASQSFGRFMKP